jgi:transcriptional regulator with XRE-family HTH domain
MLTAEQERNIKSPAQLGRLFRRHYGESAKLARELRLSRATVSRWFRGHVSSRRIDAAVRARASELIGRERLPVSSFEADPAA